MRQSFPLSLRRRQEGRHLAKRKRNNFAKIGTICVVLMVALGLMGVGYAAWSEVLNINATVEIGTWGGSLSDPSPTTSGTIVLSTSPNVLTVTITSAEADTTYTGYFNVNNTGTVPIKIDSITPADVPEGVTDSVMVATPIEPGIPAVGTITVITGASPPGVFSFTETFVFVQWNQ